MAALSPVLAVGGVVFAPGPRVLLVERRNPPLAGRWTLPGGRVEGGESLCHAVAREIAEETTIEVTVGGLIEAVELVAEGFHYVVLDYLCHALDPKQVPRPGDDAAAARYVDCSELGRLGMTTEVMQVIGKALAMQSSPATSTLEPTRPPQGGGR